jgi:hypothetical protein
MRCRTPDERFAGWPAFRSSRTTWKFLRDSGALRVHYRTKAPPPPTQSCFCTASHRGATCTGR